MCHVFWYCWVNLELILLYVFISSPSRTLDKERKDFPAKLMIKNWPLRVQSVWLNYSNSLRAHWPTTTCWHAAIYHAPLNQTFPFLIVNLQCANVRSHPFLSWLPLSLPCKCHNLSYYWYLRNSFLLLCPISVFTVMTVEDKILLHNSWNLSSLLWSRELYPYQVWILF